MINEMICTLILACVGMFFAVIVPCIIADAYDCPSTYIPTLYRKLHRPAFVILLTSILIGCLFMVAVAYHTVRIILEAVAAW